MHIDQLISIVLPAEVQELAGPISALLKKVAGGLNVKNEAAAEIPTDLIDQLAFVGPKEHMRDQIAEWKALDIDFTLVVSFSAAEADRQLALIRDLTEMM